MIFCWHIPHSCQIDWHKGKDVTVKTIKKKQKHKGRGTVRTVTKQVPNDSFFNFFNPIKGTNSHRYILCKELFKWIFLNKLHKWHSSYMGNWVGLRQRSTHSPAGWLACSVVWKLASLCVMWPAAALNSIHQQAALNSRHDCRARVGWTLHKKLCLLDFYEYFISFSLLTCFSLFFHWWSTLECCNI